MARFYLQVVNGKKWHYCRASVSEFLESYIKKKVWHLWEGESPDYIGYFNTQKELLEFIGAEE